MQFRSQRNGSEFRILCRPQLYGSLYDALGYLGHPISTQRRWGEIVPPSTSQGKHFPSRTLSTYAYQPNFNDCDLGYVMTNGLCPIFKGPIVRPLRIQ
jgi:hypothetical protein